MNKSLEFKLFDTYPEVLRKKDFPTGLPIDDGWYVILDTICYHINHRINVIHWGYNHKEQKKIHCEVRIIELGREDYDGCLTFKFDIDWILASPTHELMVELNTRLEELTNLVQTWSSRTCELSGRPGQNYVSIDDARVSRTLDPNVAKALNFVDESYHRKEQ
jgi:hypothetical protein